MQEHRTESSGRSRQQNRRLKLALKVETREGTDRLEAFSDAVFAIAATLLVINIKAPSGLSDSTQLLDALIGQWPVYVSYVMSFIYLGIYWSHHHNIYAFFKRTDHIFLKLNLLFLMMIALIPFPTALLGSYLHVRDEKQRIAVLVYTVSLFVTAILFLSIWLYAAHKHRLVDQNLDNNIIRATTMQYLIGPISYGISFLVALWHPGASLIVVLLVTLFYLLPLEVISRD
jgi:uncharacterized membrane protein